MRLKISVSNVILALATAMLFGCQSTPPQEELKSFDYGPQPENYEQIVRDYLAPKLNDKANATISFKAGPKKLYQPYSVAVDQVWGWGVCVMVNDKNPLGIYGGVRPVVLFIRNGKVVSANNAQGWEPVGSGYAKKGCSELGYEVP